MKKVILSMVALALCTALLCGCQAFSGAIAKVENAAEQTFDAVQEAAGKRSGPAGEIAERPEDTEQILIDEYGALAGAAATGDRELCRAAMPNLITYGVETDGYFSGDRASDYIQWNAEPIFDCVDVSSPDTILEGAAYLREHITPLLIEKWGETDEWDGGDVYRLDRWTVWFNDPMDCENLPLTPDAVTPAANGETKYLFLRRAQGGNDPTDWVLDVKLQSALPAKYAPATMAEVTQLIIIDTDWEYDFSFDDGTEGHKAVTQITVKGAQGEKSLEPLVTKPNTVVPYFGDTPEAIYAFVRLNDIYDYIAVQLGIE